MKLPNAHLAVIERGKIVDYLLNPSHRYGGSKAAFFSKQGFTVRNWPLMARALHDHGERNPVAKMAQTGFGPRYQVDGRLCTPRGQAPHVRTIWQFDEGQLAPRLITAYPLKPHD